MSKKSQKEKAYNATKDNVSKEDETLLRTYFDNSEKYYSNTKITKYLLKICNLDISLQKILFENNELFSKGFFKCLMTNNFVNNIFSNTYSVNNKKIDPDYYYNLFHDEKEKLLNYLRNKEDYEAIIKFLDDDTKNFNMTFE